MKEVTVDQSALPIPVDRNSPVPLYFQVAQQLERMIESGDLAAGTRLENEIDLADRLSLSRPTMRRAIGYLVDRGLLVRKRGVGTQVVPAQVRRQLELTSLYDDLARTRRDPRTRVLSFATEPASGAFLLTTAGSRFQTSGREGGRMKPAPFTYHDPSTVAEAAGLLARSTMRGCWPAASR